jgi:hypothetical protein
MAGRYYKLDEKRNVVEISFEEFTSRYETMERVIRSNTFLQDWKGALVEIRVSTVFLGIDHGWSPDEPPVVFETMIFGGPESEYQERYSTEAEAIEGHEKALQIAGRHGFLKELGS